MNSNSTQRIAHHRGVLGLAVIAAIVGCSGTTTSRTDTGTDVASDATADTGIDAPTDVPFAPDTVDEADAGTGMDMDSGPDAVSDAPPDAVTDALTDATTDVPILPLPTRPNIVVIMDDDLDRASFERMLTAGMLPHIQASIAAAGLDFDNYFAANPLCCPSRASFLAGQYSHNTNVLTNNVPTTPGMRPTGGFVAFDDRSTLATWLHGAGYYTSLVGKYMNGYGTDLPYYSTGSGDGSHYVPPGWDDWHGLSGGTYNMTRFTIVDNGTPHDFGTSAGDPPDGGLTSPDLGAPPGVPYQTDVLAQRAVNVINNTPSARPLYLQVTTVAPHVEIPNPYTSQYGGGVRPPARYAGTITWTLPDSPAVNEADVADKPAWLQAVPRFNPGQLTDLSQSYYRQRLEALRAVDDLVGSVTDALRANGRLENTVFVVVSDNGYLLGQHRLFAKENMFEDSIRIPMIVHMPGMTGARHVSQFVVNSDMAPTFVALAGATIPASVDGRSIVPLLRGLSPAWRNRFPIEHWDGVEGDETTGNPHTAIPTYRGVRTALVGPTFTNRAFAYYTEINQFEAYSLDADPDQLTSFASDPARADEVTSLRGAAGMLSMCAGATCRTLEDR